MQRLCSSIRKTRSSTKFSTFYLVTLYSTDNVRLKDQVRFSSLNVYTTPEKAYETIELELKAFQIDHGYTDEAMNNIIEWRHTNKKHCFQELANDGMSSVVQLNIGRFDFQVWVINRLEVVQ